MTTTKLLALRKEIKRRKPIFTRQDTHKKVSIKQKWKRPHGIQSKMRLHIRGYRRSVTKGFRSPRKVRGLNPAGKVEVLVATSSDLARVTEGAVAKIRSSVGGRKRALLVKEAVKLSIPIVNLKDPQGYLAKVEAELKERKTKKVKKKVATPAPEKKAEKTKAAPAEQSSIETLTEQSDDEKKAQEKKDRDRFLATKQ